MPKPMSFKKWWKQASDKERQNCVAEVYTGVFSYLEKKWRGQSPRAGRRPS